MRSLVILKNWAWASGLGAFLLTGEECLIEFRPKRIRFNTQCPLATAVCSAGGEVRDTLKWGEE